MRAITLSVLALSLAVAACIDLAPNRFDPAPCVSRCVATGERCSVDDDCVSNLCVDGICAVPTVSAPSCTNQVKDGDETDLDCGGTCKACVAGQQCSVPGDCATSLCTASHCTAPGCANGVKDGDEVATDCGGSCAPCGSGTPCSAPNQCASGVCTTTCQAPSCFDSVKNSDESAADCGGACAPCTADSVCNADTDCWNRDCDDDHKCTTNCPAEMIPLLGKRCVDRTEVSWGTYKAWIATAPDLAHQPVYCSGNTSYTENGATCASSNDDSHQNYPVRCVDWCDSAAFCAAHGKKLCGAAQGGHVPPAQRVTQTSNWYGACAGVFNSNYAYGSAYQAGTCNDNSTMTTPWDVGSHAACISEVDALDINGNVSEWEDSCDAYDGMDDPCSTRGGNYSSATTIASCNSTEPHARSYAAATHGFRCCSLR